MNEQAGPTAGLPSIADADSRLVRALHLSGQWYWETDAEHRFSYISSSFHGPEADGAKRFLGKTRFEALGVDPEAAEWAGHSADLAARRPFYGFVYRLRDESGRDRFTRISGEPHFAENGAFLGYLGIGSDVTGEMDGTGNISYRHGELIEALEASRDVFALFDSEDRLVHAGNHWRNLYVPAASQWIQPGLTFADVVRVICEHGEVVCDEATLEAFVAKRLARHRQPEAAFEYTLRDGRIIETREKTTAWGTLIAVSTDVTESRRLQDDLNKRINELSCLYDTARLYSEPGLPLTEMLQAIADRLPAGFRHVDECSARIVFEDAVYVSGGFREGSRRLASEIRIDGAVTGHIEVFSNDGDCGPGSEPFLAEGRHLVDRLAYGIAAGISHRRTRHRALTSEKMLARAASLANIGFLIWDDIAAEVAHCSPQLAALAGMNVDDFMRRAGDLDRMLEIVHPDDRDRLREFALMPVTDDFPHELVYRIVRDDGSVRYWHELTDPVNDSEGYTGKSICTIQDITAFKEREAELSRTKNFLQAQFNAAPVAIVAFDLNGNVTAWNGAAERITGWSANELIGRRVPTESPEEDRAFLERLRNVASSDGRQLYRGPRLRKDGTFYEARVHASPLRGDDGTVEGVLSIVEDVTEQVVVERELRASETRFRDVADLLPLALAITDVESGRILFANERCKQLFGSDAEGMDYAQHYYADPRDRQRIRAILEHDGSVTGTELEIRRRDGAARWVSVVVRKIEFDGRPGYCTAFLDITERKRMEEELEQRKESMRQAQRLEALGTLAGGIAHDFNNVLQPLMLGLEEISLAMGEASELQTDLEICKTATRRAAGLVRQVLDFSRSESSGNLSPRNFSAVVRKALRLPQASMPGIRWGIDIEDGVGPVRCDPQQIQRVLANLAVNAMQASDSRGTIRVGLCAVTVSQRRRAINLAAGRYALLTVGDDGAGMDKATRQRMFEPFFTTKPVNEGTGLGLSVVHGIVTAHGGTIHVTSAPGQGTIFELYFPLGKSALEQDDYQEV